MTSQELRRLADEADVRAMITRLALLADTGPLCDYAALFTEDARWALPDAVRTGRADIVAGARERRAAAITGPGSHTRHVVMPMAVRFDGADTAAADSYWMFYVNTASEPRLSLMGQYRDLWRRTATGWLLADRDIIAG
jgi:3-phenylpropionate/cinnamic acid dioxygenase small subunit